ncbi:cyclin-dependent kinase 2-interacting protein-like [Physella acuta]|uniref:cyclin-dependent kinase 2-interacting protein-like n=1 Tax=Physella acuta TaxID=109671 RepID=UPI0027DDE3AA|nr:cyclin-dependent kinase 2-interacting protein-like [Physella acuta]XP_059155033.1 cyclin-dependent kinase 2-interacting protein-like [Physella acuta]XP_059155034.1 cyclin-dependent kinase 2-interacting protein-like [Physella acuta]
MSSESNDQNKLSSVASPVPQVKHHAAGNLTGELRKVKDLAADYHNLTMKWNNLNSQGMDIITKIANIKIDKVFNVEKDPDSETHTDLPLELNPLCDALSDIVDAMSRVESKLEHKAKIAEGLLSLQKYQRSASSSPVLFSTMTLEDVVNTVKEIHQYFGQELKLKRELCRQLAHAGSRDVMMFYSTCWLHQPYLQAGWEDQLQALLSETGHV